MSEKINPEIPLEDFLIWWTKPHKIITDGHEKVHSFRFGRSIWIICDQETVARFAMTNKQVINNLINKLINEGYIEYVGLKTYQMSEKALKVLHQYRERPLPPSDYKDYVRT